MTEPSAEEIELDAGEYVLGTLDDVSRAGLERTRASDARACRALTFWQDRLNILGLALDPVEPPAAVWQRIEASLDDAESAGPAGEPAQTGARSRYLPWRLAAIAASVVAVVLAALLVTGPAYDDNADTVPAYASIIRDKPTGMSWLVTVEPNTRLMVVRAMGNYGVPEGKVLKAWVKPEGGKPAFVGVLPHSVGRYSMKVPKYVARSLGDNAKLMVTIENAGTGHASPSGKLMWATPIVHRTG